MLKGVTPRLYQEAIFASCTDKNSLVVLPTGLGKTLIAVLLAAHRKKLYPSSKVVIVAPTKPLVEQHVEVFREHCDIPSEDFVVLTGEVSPVKRSAVYNSGSFIFATPQTVENDVLNGVFPLDDVSLLVVDEAHRAVGEYSYVFLAREFQRKSRFPRILALTASPGDSVDVLKEVCENLFIEHVEVRSVEDADVKPYVQPLKVDWVRVELPESFSSVRTVLKDSFFERVKVLRGMNVLSTLSPSKSDLLAAQRSLQSSLSTGDSSLFKALSVLAEALKISHAVELFESQGIVQAVTYLERLGADAVSSKSRAVKSVMSDERIKSALLKCRSLVKDGVVHPKLLKLKELVSLTSEKCIIFTQFRDSAVEIKNILGEGEIFVGQAKKGATGLSQKEQLSVLQRFREGVFKVLICTSVGEEGLDIPKVNLVIFYEPVPSAIRSIQRRGRTARDSGGRVVVLLSKGTRDEALQWVSKKKEERMQRVVSQLGFLTPQKVLSRQEVLPGGVFVSVDYREKKSQRLESLREQGVQVRLESLPVGDYVLSSRVGVELKTVVDFVDSLIDGRIFVQVRELKKQFERPLIIVEGEESLNTVRNVHPNAVRGLLASILVDYGVPVMFSKDSTETAVFIASVAKREADKGVSSPVLHRKKGDSLAGQQEFLVSAISGVGLAVARSLLLRFRSIERLAGASVEELQEVDGVGRILAGKIRAVLSQEYFPFGESMAGEKSSELSQGESL